MERYIKEYAAAQIKEIESSKDYTNEYKNAVICRIQKATQYRKCGFLTVNDTIKAILEAREN